MKAGLMLAVNPNTKREENDFYATDSYAILKMKQAFIDCGLSHKVWECACGNGNLSEPLKALGYEVKSSDLIQRAYPCEKINFLETNTIWDGDILTNPPFKIANEFVEHGMGLLLDGHKMWLLLKVQFLETTKRAEMFKRNGLKMVIVNSSRVGCARCGDFDKYFTKDPVTGVYKGGTQCYCWFVFEKNFLATPS